MNFEVIFETIMFLSIILLFPAYFFYCLFSVMVEDKKEKNLEKKYPMYRLKKKEHKNLIAENESLYEDKIYPLSKKIDDFLLRKKYLPIEEIKNQEIVIERIKNKRIILLKEHEDRRKKIESVSDEVFHIKKQILEKGK